MGLSPRVEKVNIDIGNDFTGEAIWAVQGELNALLLDVTVLQMGKSLDLEGTEVTFRTRTPDGFMNDQVLGAVDSGVTAGENIGQVTVTPSPQVFEREGVVDCELIVRDPAAKIVVKTPVFQLHVLGSINE